MIDKDLIWHIIQTWLTYTELNSVGQRMSLWCSECQLVLDKMQNEYKFTVSCWIFTVCFSSLSSPESVGRFSAIFKKCINWVLLLSVLVLWPVDQSLMLRLDTKVTLLDQSVTKMFKNSVIRNPSTKKDRNVMRNMMLSLTLSTMSNVKMLLQDTVSILIHRYSNSWTAK